MPDAVQAPEDSLRGFHAAHETVLAAMDSLPTQWRSVLWRAEVMDTDHAQIALLMRIAPEEVPSLLEAARVGLRHAYLAVADSMPADAEI